MPRTVQESMVGWSECECSLDVAKAKHEHAPARCGNAALESMEQPALQHCVNFQSGIVSDCAILPMLKYGYLELVPQRSGWTLGILIVL